MSNPNGAGLSKYQEALNRLKSEPAQAAPDFVEDPAVPEAVAEPASDAPSAAPEVVAEPVSTAPSAAPEVIAEPVSDAPSEDSQDGVISFLDDIAADHGLLETPATAEAAPPASDAEVPSEAPTADSAGETPPAEAESPAKKTDASMDAYLKSLNKLKEETGSPGASGGQKEAEEDKSQTAADALKAARGMMGGANRKGDTRDQQALERLKERSTIQEAAEKKPRRVPALRGVLHSEDDCAPCAPKAARRKAKAKRKAETADTSRLAELPPLALKAGICLAVLAAGLLLQFAVFLLLDTPFVLRDLLAGASAVLPAGLVLVLATPETDRDWRAVIGGAAALGLTASLAFALSLATAYSEPVASTHIVVVIFLELGILTLLLGPVILAVAAWLHRLELITLTDPLYS